MQQWALVHILLARIAVFLCIFGTKYVVSCSVSRRSLPVRHASRCMLSAALASPHRYVLWIPDEHYLNILQPFIHIVLVERVTHEHHTVPPRLDVNNKWSFLARVRWWLIAAWVRGALLAGVKVGKAAHTYILAGCCCCCLPVCVYICVQIMWGGNLAMIARHGYFGPCLFEGPLRVTAVALWVILLAGEVLGWLAGAVWPRRR